MSSDNVDKEFTTETKVGLGVLAGVAAAAGLAAVYLYSTKDGQKYRKQFQKWMTDVKKDVVAELQKLQKVDKDVYVNVIDNVVSQYQQMDDVNTEELISFGKELKRQYETIRKEMDTPTTKKKKSTRKTSRKKSSSSTAKKTKSTRAKKA